MRMRAVLVLAVAIQAGSAAARDAVGFSISTLASPFTVALLDGARAAADRAGLELVVLDAQGKAEKQATDLEELLRGQVRVIVIHPVDAAALLPAVEQANLANVPVITVERPVAAGKVAYHIASDEVAGGRLAGEYVCRLLGGRGEVAELEGIPGSSEARERGQGFGEGLRRSCRGVKLLARETAQADRAEGLTVMEGILQAHPAIDAVFAEDDEMALGAVHALKPGNRPVRIIGFGGSEDALRAVVACELTATVAPQPAQMGRYAVEKARTLLRPGRVPERTAVVAVALKLVTHPACR